MKQWMHKIELLVDKSIPYCLVIITVMVVGELFFQSYVSPYQFYFSIADSIVVAIFILDLIFKYVRMRYSPLFFKKYWLEIIAVFPTFLVLRMIESFAPIVNIGESLQKSFHETLAIEQEGKILVQEIERTGKESSRFRYFLKFARPLARAPRLLKAFSFYEKPTGRHHPHEK